MEFTFQLFIFKTCVVISELYVSTYSFSTDEYMKSSAGYSVLVKSFLILSNLHIPVETNISGVQTSEFQLSCS